MSGGNKGFTLVELLVVAVVGSMVMMTIYGVLASNQRANTVQSAQIRSQQIVRAGFEVLFAELREVSATGGDVFRIDPDSIRVRSMRNFGLVCGVDQTVVPPEITVRRIGDWFADGDSIVLFADGNTAIASDDVWLTGTAGTVDTSATCPGGEAAQVIDLPGLDLSLIHI